MTSQERLFSLISAVEYIERAGVRGDFVECGVWKGGSVMAMALTLLRLQKQDRRIFLFDTFQGMVEPDQVDVDRSGESAAAEFSIRKEGNSAGSDWCKAEIDEVRANVRSIGYPMDLFEFVQGKVEDTLPENAPETIALLRVDTDWYSSTLHELETLYPRLVRGGVLIIDDYGYWQGAQKATDEYFSQHQNVYMHRIDNTARLIVKPE
jgi:hypothetical protein